MKKLSLTIAIIIGFGMTTFADPNGGGMFQRGAESEAFQGANWRETPAMPALPSHGQSNNQNAPLGSGLVALIGLGAAYLIAERRKED